MSIDVEVIHYATAHQTAVYSNKWCILPAKSVFKVSFLAKM